MKKRLTKVLYFTIGMLGTLFMSGCGKKELLLNDYLEYSIQGYDTLGYVTCTFDEERFVEDVILNDEKANYSDVNVLTNRCITYNWSQMDHLQNGDNVTLKWDVNDDFEKKYKVKLKYENLDIKVEVPDIIYFDPFEGMRVEFNGASGAANCSKIYFSEDIYNEDITYSFDPDNPFNLSHYANGDEVIVEAHIWSNNGFTNEEEYCLEHEGHYPTRLECTYTVSDIPEFIVTVDEIPEDTLLEMIETSKKLLEEKGGYFNGYRAYSSIEYVGSLTYFQRNSNEVNLVFETVCENVTAYEYVRYIDVTKNSDGTINVDLTSGKRSNALYGYYYGKSKIKNLFWYSNSNNYITTGKVSTMSE